MSGVILEFPTQSRTAIRIVDSDDGLLVLTPRGHGWLHGDLDAARADAAWLSRNLGLPIMERRS